MDWTRYPAVPENERTEELAAKILEWESLASTKQNWGANVSEVDTETYKQNMRIADAKTYLARLRRKDNPWKKPLTPEKEKPERKKKVDLNEATRKWCERKGYFPYRADYYDARTQRQQDFMGLFDYLALGHGETLAIQVTTKANMSARRNKIQDKPKRCELLKSCGWKILLLGFYKADNGRWDAVEQWL